VTRCNGQVERLDDGGQQKGSAAIVSRFMKLDLDQDDLFAFLNDCATSYR
jgi:hypothetical protein